MVSRTAMESLRMAATLALAVPTLRVRVTWPARPPLEVAWMPRELPAGWHHIVPCAFRRSIACASAQLAAGRSVTLWGATPESDPGVEVIGPGEAPTIPPDIHQVRVEGGWRAVFPTLLPVAACARNLGAGWPALGFHADTLTGVTLVHGRRSDGQGPFAGHCAEQLVEARARLLVAELLHGVELSTA